MKKMVMLFLLGLVLSCTSGREPLVPSAAILSDRLSNPDIHCFLRDSLGVMWIGTDRGLNRYNGYEYHQYLYDGSGTSLPDDRVYSVCMDHSGRLWVGTENGVAYKADDDRFVRVPIDSEEKAVYQIVCDRRGRLLVNMLEDLCMLDTLSGRFVSVCYGFDRYNSYRSVCYPGEGDDLWVVAPCEIRRFNMAEDFENLDNFPTTHFVTASRMLSDGQIWMAGRHQTSVFDTRRMVFLEMPEAVVQAIGGQEVHLIYELAPGMVFFHTSDNKLFFYDRGKDLVHLLTPSFFGLPEGFVVRTMYKDQTGNLWLGSEDKGFHFFPYLSEALASNLQLRAPLDNQSVVSISRDGEGILWIYTLHDGLYRYDYAGGTLVRPEAEGFSVTEGTDFLQYNSPMVLATEQGDIWFSPPNQQKLFHGRYHDGKLTLSSSHGVFYPRVAVEDKEGGVWFGLRNEFVAYVPPGGEKPELIQIWPYKTTFINCLLVLDDELLVGAYDEPLALLNIHTRQLRMLDMAGADMARCIGNDYFNPTCFCLDREGNIWIGTRSSGVLRYESAHKRLNPVPGLIAGEISSIEEGVDGRLWVSAEGGLGLYDPLSGEIHDYLPRQEMGGSLFYNHASALLPDGTLVFGGTDGLTILPPDEERRNDLMPLIFDDLKVHNQRMLPQQRVSLSHRDNSFSLSFSVPDFRRQERIRYSYILEGYQKDWVDLGVSREVFLTHVPAGKYLLRVRYYLRPDDQPFMENSLPVVVSPSPWWSPWAKAGYLLVSVLLLWGAWMLRRRFLREQAAVKEAEKEKEQEQRLNKMNMAFFSNISHEFRTPLTMISGPVAELSRSGRLQEEDVHRLSIVERSVDRMLALVNQLMDVSKLENASLPLHVSRTNLSTLLGGCLELFQLNAGSRELTLESRGLEEPFYAWVDADKVQKMVGNLLSNAVKFTPKGGQILLEVDQVRQEGVDHVKIEVADTGPGLPSDQLEKIFDRYYQLDNQQEGQYNYGTGIGLYYARSLAEIHHGSLTAANRSQGHGAVFTLLLPVREEAYRPEEREKTETTVHEEYPMETVPQMVQATSAGREDLPLLLAVDDDPDVLRYLEVLLSAQYRVLTAGDAEEAFQLASDKAPDVILSDVAMPGKDGFALCRELKSALPLCHIPVILVTAMGTVQNQVKGLDLGADAYVTKPFDPDYLKALVRSLLENRRRLQGLVNAATESSEVETLSSRDKAFLDQLYGLMEAELSNEDLDVGRLTDLMKISRTKLYYKIKGLTGKTPSEFFMQYKLNVAAKLLKEGRLNVSEIAVKTGFNTLPHFSKAFKKQFGVAPSKYAG